MHVSTLSLTVAAVACVRAGRVHQPWALHAAWNCMQRNACAQNKKTMSRLPSRGNGRSGVFRHSVRPGVLSRACARPRCESVRAQELRRGPMSAVSEQPAHDARELSSLYHHESIITTGLDAIKAAALNSLIIQHQSDPSHLPRGGTLHQGIRSRVVWGTASGVPLASR